LIELLSGLEGDIRALYEGCEKRDEARTEIHQKMLAA